MGYLVTKTNVHQLLHQFCMVNLVKRIAQVQETSANFVLLAQEFGYSGGESYDLVLSSAYS